MMRRPTYVALELRVTPWGDGYRVQIKSRLSTSGIIDRDHSAKEPARFDRAALHAASNDVAGYGRLLTDALLADAQVRQVFTDAYAQARSHNALRLRLALDRGASGLSDLRWEWLQNPDSGEPLAVSERVLLSRYLPGGDGTPLHRERGDAPRALVLIASPRDLAERGLAPIDVQREHGRILEALGGIKSRTLKTGAAQPPTLANLLAALSGGEELLIIVAHGTAEEGGPYLWLEREDGLAEQVEAEALVKQINDAGRRPRCVVLAACESAGRADTPEALADLGAALVERAGVPAVVAMRGRVSMAAMKAFLPTLLSELRRDGQIDRAVAAARRVARHEHDDWWVPVLYSRLEDGRLWEPAPRRPIAAALVVGALLVALVLGFALVSGLGRAAPAQGEQAAAVAAPTPPPVCEPAGDDERLVLVVPFYANEATTGAEPHRVIINALDDAIIDYDLDGLNIRAELAVTEPIADNKPGRAQAIGADCRASVVIWGSHLKETFSANILALTPDASGAMVPADPGRLAREDSALTDPEVFNTFLNQELTGRAEVSALFALARVAEARGQYGPATTLLDQITPADPPENRLAAQADAAFLLGWIYQTRLKEPASAVEAYTDAVKWNPQLATAHYNLANARRAPAPGKSEPDAEALAAAIIDYTNAIAVLSEDRGGSAGDTDGADLYDLAHYGRGTARLALAGGLTRAVKEPLDRDGRLDDAEAQLAEAQLAETAAYLDGAEGDLGIVLAQAQDFMLASYDYGVVLQTHAERLLQETRLACELGRPGPADAEAAARGYWERSLTAFDAILGDVVPGELPGEELQNLALFNRGVSRHLLGDLEGARTDLEAYRDAPRKAALSRGTLEFIGAVSRGVEPPAWPICGE